MDSIKAAFSPASNEPLCSFRSLAGKPSGVGTALANTAYARCSGAAPLGIGFAAPHEGSRLLGPPLLDEDGQAARQRLRVGLAAQHVERLLRGTLQKGEISFAAGDLLVE